MANVLCYENLASNKYKYITPPVWGAGSVQSGHYEWEFVGRPGEDIRMFDHATSQYTKVQGPIVTMVLDAMEATVWDALKLASGLSGTVIARRVKNKNFIDPTTGKPCVYAGALWMPL